MLNGVRVWPCAKVIPMAYDDALSYYEQICKLVHKINEVIEELNSINIDEILNEVDERIAVSNAELNKKMEYLMNQVVTVMDNVNNALENQDKKVDVILGNAINDLTIHLNSQLQSLKLYIDSADNAMLIKWELIFEQFLNSLPELNTVYVISPFTGLTITVQDAINEIWNYLKQYSLTAYEYDSQLWTAEEYDGFKMTAFNYDYYAKRYFYKNPDLYMYSPFTGEYVKVTAVVEMLAQLHRTEALDADNYDALNLTCTEYDGKTLTAYNYDWHARELLM